MVVCNMEVPRPPPPPFQILGSKLESGSIRSRKSAHSQGFRLLDNLDDTGSVYSIYKQKIDSMFESDSSANTKNSVQARIEKMFTDVAKDGGIPNTEIGCHVFSVDYMGSVPLQHKVASLAGLQDPLKELYFAYKRTSKAKKPLTGRLEISATGLKVLYQGEKGDLEQLNSFPTIAVWSAVKFVLHEDGKASYAFLPLITDPDNIDKQTLFRTLDGNEKKYITKETHSPLFAVVMRKMGVQKQLECHGFICQTSEDAIVIAATLYKSLMGHMKSKDKRPMNKNGITCMSLASSVLNESSSNLAPVRPPRKKRSTSSSTGSDKDVVDSSPSQPLLPHSQSPKKSTKTKRAPKAPQQKPDLDAILPYDDVTKDDHEKDELKPIKPAALAQKWSTFMSAQQKQITAEFKQVVSEGSHRGLQRAQSFGKREEAGILNQLVPDMAGDILTKVTIPRSGSFLNAGGLTRYKSKFSRLNGQATGGSPLGFTELFNEFRLQENLHSVDEILGVIIDPEGMSFNDLKPIYKEFLLKLAVTLTKDELYQRSKAIMRRQKKKLLRRTSSIQPKKRNIIVNQRFKSLKHIFRKTLKVKLSKRLAKAQRQRVIDVPVEVNQKVAESSISTSSYDTRQFRPKPSSGNHVGRKQSYRKRSGELKANRRERTSTSEESDFLSLRRGKNKGHFQAAGGNQNRNSSSGYVSCSECSYDSDTCTCVSADKCYCSLGQKNLTRKHKGKCKNTLQSCGHSCKTEEKCYCSWQNPHDSLSWCGCDTDSCTDSNKCYCRKGETVTIIEQLKQRGLIPSVESITTSRSHRKLCKNNSNTKSSKSLEYMPNPTEEYYEKLKAKQLEALAKRNSYAGRSGRSFNADNLAVDYELFAISNRNVHNIRSRTVYGKAASECGHPSLCKQASVRSVNGASKYAGRREGRTLRSTSISAGACTEALSVKKSAEIAALFADIKLSQTTDITHLMPQNYERDAHKSAQSRSAHKSYANLKSESNSEGNLLPPSGRLSKNGLYSSKNLGKNKMYSARNGLYTIQSQSDDSRRSSVCEPVRSRDVREYFTLEPQFDPQEDKKLSSNIGDSLGYLP